MWHVASEVGMNKICISGYYGKNEDGAPED